MPPALYNNLRNLGMGLIITDTAGRRDVVHMHLPVPRALIRFVGNSLHPTDYHAGGRLGEPAGLLAGQRARRCLYFHAYAR